MIRVFVLLMLVAGSCWGKMYDVKVITNTVSNDEVKVVERKEICDWCGGVMKHEKLYHNQWYDIAEIKNNIKNNEEIAKAQELILKSTDYFGANNFEGIFVSFVGTPAYKYLLKIDVDKIGGDVGFGSITNSSSIFLGGLMLSENKSHEYEHYVELCPDCYKKVKEKLVKEK